MRLDRDDAAIESMNGARFVHDALELHGRHPNAPGRPTFRLK
jgi:hypothetical protein